MTNEVVDAYLKTSKQDVQRVGDVVNSRTSIQWTCSQNHQWSTTPSNIIHKQSGCSVCLHASKRLKEKEVDRRLHQINMKRMSKFTTSRDSIDIQCLHNTEHNWTVLVAGSLLRTQPSSCPHCRGLNTKGGILTIVDGITFRSRLEATAYVKFKEYTDHHGFKLTLQRRYRDHSKHTCDFVIETANVELWIEVSNYTAQEYLDRIEVKRGWIEQQDKTFFFGASADDIITKIDDML